MKKLIKEKNGRILAFGLALLMLIESMGFAAAEEPENDGVTEVSSDEVLNTPSGDILFSADDTITEVPDAAVCVDLSDELPMYGGFPEENKEECATEAAAMAAAADYDKAEALICEAIKKWKGQEMIEADISSCHIPFSDESFIAWIRGRHPEFFYLSGNVSYFQDAGYYQKVWFTADTNYSTLDVDRFYQYSDRVMAGIDPAWTKLQTAAYLHDYLVTHTSYAYDENGKPGKKYNAYNALVEGSAVCQGYSEAYTYLMKQAGIECGMISSIALNHAWNMVKIEDKYYYVDCTWDDPSNSYEYNCGHGSFMRSREGMISTGHTSTDWITNDGTNAYTSIEASKDHDNAPYLASNAVIAMSGRSGAYFGEYKKDNPITVYKYDFENGQSSRLVSYEASWKVSDRSAYAWLANFGGLAAVGDSFFISKPGGIIRVGAGGGSAETVYSLKSSEKSKGQIYGCLETDGKLNYSLYKYSSKGVYKKGGSGTIDLNKYDKRVHVSSLKLDKMRLTMKPGDRYALKLGIEPADAGDKSVKWVSSDTDVVSVNSAGELLSVSVGRATVRATSKDRGISAVCRVCVNETGITEEEECTSALDTYLDTKKYDEFFLVKGVKYCTDSDRGWCSSDSTVASVSKGGFITAKGRGEAVITAADNSMSFKLYVSEVYLDTGRADMIVGDSLMLKLCGIDHEDMYPVLWYSSAPSAVSVSGGQIRAEGAGSAVVTAYAGGKAMKCKVRVKEKAAGDLSISENRTLYLNAGQKKKISLPGIKARELSWESSDRAVAYVDNGRIVAGSKSGRTELSAKTEMNGTVYSFCMEVYTEVPAFLAEGLVMSGKNKYSMTLSAGSKMQIFGEGFKQPAVFTGGKAGVAFIDENGRLYARKAGKCSFTAKINGKKYRIKLNVL